MTHFVRPVAAALVLVLLLILGWTTFVTSSEPRDPWPGTGVWAEATLDDLTLEQKVSQLFSARAFGSFAASDAPSYEELVDLVENFEIGGLIFFQGDPLSQTTLINDLQEQAALPLLISQDMEWGAGMRVEGATSFPRAMAIGATRNPDYAYAVGRVTAEEARAMGVHQIYAPVADINNNPSNPVINVRSYGERPDLVAQMVTAFVRGAQDGGVIATAKHFPGHGDTATDSHADLPVLAFDQSRLDSLELIPFKAAVDAGLMSVMTGHLALPQLEPNVRVPATLSPRVTQALLRDELEFRGLIVTDALNMRGVTKHFGPGEIAVRALEAGADQLLMSEDVYAARQAVLDAVKSGRLTEQRIDESVLRILKAKEWLNLHKTRLVDAGKTRSNVGTMAHKALSETIVRQSLTLLSNAGGLLPLAPGATGRVLSIMLSDSNNPDRGRAFNQHLAPYVAADSLMTLLVDRRSGRDEIRAALDAVQTHDVVLVPTFLIVRSSSGRIGLSDAHKDFLDQLIATGKPVVIVAFGNPYLASSLARQPAAYMAVYGNEDEMQKAAAQGIFGASGFHGLLPITVPGLYAFGDGLDVEQTRLRRGYPEEVGMDSGTLARADSLMRAAIAAKAFPGAAVAIGRRDVLVKLDGYGYFTYAGLQHATPQSRFDLASLTKVIATTTAAMKLYEAGQLDLDANVASYLPPFGQSGKENVTIRHLLTHTSGLPAFRPFHTMGITTREGVVNYIMQTPLEFESGAKAQYSDFGMITMALVIEQITGQPYAAWVDANIFEPLGMHDTRFRTPNATDTTIVPTEIDNLFRHRLVQGEVHDETAWILGGVAGHAGLFSTADDLAKFAHMLVNSGRIYGKPFLKPETIRLFTTRAGEEHTRALGWDTKSSTGYSSAGQRFGPRSFGHTGFTGTSLWIDPDQQLYVILLTNRVYPTRDNQGHSPVRAALADIAYEAIQEEPPLIPRAPAPPEGE